MDSEKAPVKNMPTFFLYPETSWEDDFRGVRLINLAEEFQYISPFNMWHGY